MEREVLSPTPRRRVRADDVDDLLELTQDPDPKVRSGAVRQLCPCHVRGHVNRIWDRFFEMVTDDDRGVRSQIFHALGDGSPRVLQPRVIAAFETMQSDPDPSLRRRARKLLAHYRRTGKYNIL